MALSALVPFDDFVAADLFLYVVVELPEEKQAQSWLWRAVSFLFLRSAPDFLVKARRRGYADLLAETYGVKDLDTFRQRLLSRLSKINNFFQGNLHYWPIKNKDVLYIGSVPPSHKLLSVRKSR